MLSALYDGSRRHKIRQVVKWRANKKQDLETIELRSEALFLMSFFKGKGCSELMFSRRCNSRFPLLNISVYSFMC